jgi:hypothetical protein
MATALWVFYDVFWGIAGFWALDRALTRNERFLVALLVVVGIGVATYSGYSDYESSQQISRLEQRVDDLSRGQAFSTGQLNGIGQVSGKTLDLLANKSNANPSAGADAVASAAVARITQLEHEVSHLLEQRHLTKEEMDIMRPILSASSQHFDLSWGHTPEAGKYAAELRTFLTTDCHWMLDFSSELTPQVQSPNPTGVILGAKDMNNPPQGDTILAGAFTHAKISWGWANNSTINPQNAWLIVGDKP